MTDVSAHLIYLQQCNNFSQLPFLMPRPGLPDGKMAAHSKDRKCQKGQWTACQVQSSVPETQSAVYTKTLETNNKTPDKSFYSVNLYRIVFLWRSNFAHQLVVSGNIFMELCTRKFLKIALCQKILFKHKSAINDRVKMPHSFASLAIPAGHRTGD